MSVILWFIVIYLLFRFIFRFVIPVISATRTVRSKVNEMRQTMESYQNTSGPGTQEATVDNGSSSYNSRQAKPADSKGDYIDFEEVK